MTTQDEQATNASAARPDVALGEFPFPLTDGPRESRYLTWLRNHSNYMAVRGFLDYLRSVGVLLRGIIINFLIFLPYLLIIAIVLAYAHHWMLANPFVLTLWAIVLGVVWVLLFPIAMPLYKIFRYRRSLQTGSESSVKQRDLYERTFSGLLLVILAIALLESVPWMLELLHHWLEQEKLSWQGGLATVVAALALLSRAEKLLSVMSGAKKKLVMVLLGIVGLLVPLLVILYATNFLLYSPPATPLVVLSPVIAAVCYVVAIVIAIPLGMWQNAYTRKESAAVFGLLVAGLLLVFGVTTAGVLPKQPDTDANDTELSRIIAPMERVASYFERLSSKHPMAPEVTNFVDEVTEARRQSRATRAAVDKEIAKLEDCRKIVQPDRWSDRWKLLTCQQRFAELEQKRFSAAVKFFELGDKLSTIPDTSLDVLRAEIANLARSDLWRLMKTQATTKPGYYGVKSKDPLDETGLVRRLRSSLFYTQLDESIQGRAQTEASANEKETATSANEADVANCKDSPDSSERVRCAYFKASATKENALENAVVRVQRILVDISNEDLAELVTEDELYKAVKFKFENLVTGEAEITRLSGKAALAGLLTKQEMLTCVLSKDPLNEDVFVEHKAGGGSSNPQPAQPARPPSNVSGIAIKWPREDFDAATKWAFTRAALPGEPAELAELATSEKPKVKLDSPSAQWWSRPDPEMMKDTINLSQEYIARVATEQLVRETLKSLTVYHLEKVVARFKDLEHLKENEVVIEGYPAQDGTSETQVNDLMQELLERYTLVELVKKLEEKTHAPDYDSLEQVDDNAKAKAKTHEVVELVLALAKKAQIHPQRFVEAVRQQLVREALRTDSKAASKPKQALDYLAEFAKFDGKTEPQNSARQPQQPYQPYARMLSAGELAFIGLAKFRAKQSSPAELEAIDNLITKLMVGKHGRLEKPDQALKRQLTDATIKSKATFLFLLAAVIWLGCWLTVDVNLTSIHGLYRDRLASAFLIGTDAKGNVDIESDVDLVDICWYGARSIAPYHLINVALNLQGSKDIGLRDRNSDFFIFSKLFTGGHRTGYCRSEIMEQVFPQMSLGTAMAISAAAASPNMGRSTSRLAVALMTLLNIRMGFWVPHPGLLEEMPNETLWKRRTKDARAATKPPGFTFEEVFAQELQEIERRWGQVYPDDAARRRISDNTKEQLRRVGRASPTVENNLVGIAFSGGGIRSAAINLGIAQALHKRGVFRHLDYMSTVSGGGYLGASISTLMRTREVLVSEIAGQVKTETAKLFSEISGEVTVTEERARPGDPGTEKDEEIKDDQKVKVVVVKGSHGEERTYRFSGDAQLAVEYGKKVKMGDPLLKYLDVVITPPSNTNEKPKKYRFAGDATLNVRDKQNVPAGRPLLKPRGTRSQSEIAGSVRVDSTETEQIVSVQGRDEQREYRFSKCDLVVVKTGDTVVPDQHLIQLHNTIGARFRWRVRPVAFLREMLSRLDETHRWVNLSDGGHIENLATIELLRRRCKYIIIGDGEADPNLHFASLATLMRCAYIDLGIKIDLDLDAIRLRKAKEDDVTVSGEHWAIGTIRYPEKDERGGHEIGHLLYLKSSFTGDEEEAIREYRHRNPNFPHQTTADQFFDEGQFEAYRALGQHIAELALDGKHLAERAPEERQRDKMSFSDFEEWFKRLGNNQGERKRAQSAAKSPHATQQTEASA